MDTKNHIKECEWEITDDKTLVIRPANGKTEGYLCREGEVWPWRGETFKKIRIEGHVIADEYINYMFSGCPALEDVSGVGDLDTSRVENMSGMFSECPALRTIAGLEKLNIRSLKNTGCMFENCSALSDISSLAGWDAANIVTMYRMFFGCAALKDISALKDWCTKSARYMSGMFYGCTSLEDASPLAGWRVASVTNMYGMFRNCTALISIDGLENWNVRSVMDMDLMFADCTCLVGREKLLNNWRLKNRNIHSGSSTDRIVSEKRMFAMSDSPMACPREGEFVGWKKCFGRKLVKLLIPADARRSSALGKRCRCDRAQVLDITDMNGNHMETAFSSYDHSFIYRKGETVSVPDFDEDRFNECAPGIHFFMDKMSAMNYL